MNVRGNLRALESAKNTVCVTTDSIDLGELKNFARVRWEAHDLMMWGLLGYNRVISEGRHLGLPQRYLQMIVVDAQVVNAATLIAVTTAKDDHLNGRSTTY